MTTRSRSPLWMISLLVVSLVALGAPGCSDDDMTAPDAGLSDGGADAPVVDAAGTDGRASDGGDAARGDGGGADPLPGCSAACKPDEVCVAGKCAAAGPAKACDATKYGPGFGAGKADSGCDKYLYVDGAAASAGDGSTAKPFKTIGAALAAVPATAAVCPSNSNEVLRYTVVVASGVYDEALAIDRSVDLVCHCAAKVRIARGVSVDAKSGALTVRVAGCTVAPVDIASALPSDWTACDKDSGGKVLGTPVGVSAVGAAAVDLRLADSVVAGWCTGVLFDQSSGAGAGAGSPPSAMCVQRSRVAANVKGIDVHSSPAPGTKPAASCDGVQSEAVVATLSLVDHNRDRGVQMRQGAPAVVLLGNRFEQTGKLGANSAPAGEGLAVYLGDSRAALIESNVFRDTRSRAVALRNVAATAGAIRIANNAAYDSGGAAIALQQLQAGQAVVLEGNLISVVKPIDREPGGDGIIASMGGGTTHDVRITGNTIEDTHRAGVFIEQLGGEVSGNTIRRSNMFGILLQVTGTAVKVGKNAFAWNLKDVERTSSLVHKYGDLPAPPP